MSQIFRVYEPITYSINSEISLSDENHHIISRVLRKNSGDKIELLNGNGQIAEAVLKQVSKKTSDVSIDHIKEMRPLEPSIRLFIGCLKGEKLSWVVQKATELGVNEIGFFNSDHSVAVKSESFLEKIDKTAIEAIRQSGNPFLPKSSFYKKIEDIECNQDSTHWNIVLDETEVFPVSKVLKEPAPQTISLFVGPEGGFSTNERQFFRDKKCRMIRIAPFVLRADTAAISAVSLFRGTFAS